MRHCGKKVLSCDITRGDCFNMLDTSVVDTFVGWIGDGRTDAVWLGTPATVCRRLDEHLKDPEQ